MGQFLSILTDATNSGIKQGFVGLERPPLSGQQGLQALAQAESIDGYRDAIEQSKPNLYARRSDVYKSALYTVSLKIPPSPLWPNGQVIWMDPTADNGLPHTRPPNLICLPASISKESLKTTLEHERIHVHQRQFPEKWEALFEKAWSMKPWHSQLPLALEEKRRLNPDLLHVPLYAWKNEWVPVQLFKSESPSSLQDSSIVWWHIPTRTVHKDAPPEWNDFFGNIPSGEHPYELAAYLLTDKNLERPATKALIRNMKSLLNLNPK